MAWDAHRGSSDMCVGFFGYARNLFPCAQPGDSGIFLRLWSNRGVLHCDPFFPCDSRMAIFQRFAICCRNGRCQGRRTTGRYARISKLWSEGVYVIALRPFYVMWEWRNSNDLGLYAGMICVRGRPLPGDMPVSSGWGRGGPAYSGSFTQCMKRSFAIHGTKRLAVRIWGGGCLGDKKPVCTDPGKSQYTD